MPDSTVHVEGVVKRFGTTTALAGVDLDVEEGTVFGLLVGGLLCRSGDDLASDPRGRGAQALPACQLGCDP